MAPWDDEERDSTAPPPAVAVAARNNFDDSDSDDVLDSWDAAEDSEVEREKAKKAEEAKVKAAAKAKAEHKSKAQRIEEKRQARVAGKDDLDLSDDEIDEAERLAEARRAEKDSDLKHAEDLFGAIGINPNRGAPKAITIQDSSDPTKSIELSSLPLFSPAGIQGFNALRDTIGPLVAQNSKKAHYALFLPEFCKQLAKDLNSEQIKKVASVLTTLSNERMKEEKAADKTGKKSKAAKTKTSLAASRDISSRADTTVYDDGLGEDDFM